MKTVDIHAHWYPREWLDLFARDAPRDGGTLERLPGGGYRIRTRLVLNQFDDTYVDLQKVIATMDKRGVDVHALSLTAPMVYWASPVRRPSAGTPISSSITRSQPRRRRLSPTATLSHSVTEPAA